MSWQTTSLATTGEQVAATVDPVSIMRQAALCGVPHSNLQQRF
jgi:hypothetical protein